MFKNILKAFLILLFINALAVAGIVAYYHIRYQAEYERAGKFEALRPGMSLSEAQSIVGEAVRIETLQGGKHQLHIYASPPLMAQPLRLTVRMQDMVVVEVWNGERLKK